MGEVDSPMILLRTGSVGEGKSYNTIAECVEHLRTGGVVATNFSLAENWAKKITRFKLSDLVDKHARIRRAQDLHSRWFHVGSVESICDLSVRLPELVSGEQAKRVERHKATGRAGKPEGLGLLVLDEGHIYFNSRNWKDNMPMINFLSQSRKKGWNVVIIAHHEDSIDSQIRQGLINECEAMRNLSNVQFIPLIPLKFGHFTMGKPLFLGIRKLSGNGGGKGMITTRQLRVLSSSVSSIYETMEEFNYLDQKQKPELIGPPPREEGEGRCSEESRILIRQALKTMADDIKQTELAVSDRTLRPIFLDLQNVKHS